MLQERVYPIVLNDAEMYLFWIILHILEWVKL